MHCSLQQFKFRTLKLYSRIDITLLTLNLQEILYGLGLARTLHSKYTSSPSLMLDPLRLLPKLSTDWGTSRKKEIIHTLST